jgi:ABC transport system ATP-binding/permease protein
MPGEILQVVAGKAAGARIEPDGEFLIGRAAQGHGTLGGDSELSRQHARLTRDQQGRLVVQDLGSTNGTFVNGSRLSAPRVLQPGDKLQVGQTTLEVRAGGDGRAAPQPAAAQAPPGARHHPTEQVQTPQPAQPQRQAAQPATGPLPGPPAQASGVHQTGNISPPADILHEGRRIPIPPKGLSMGRQPDNDIVIGVDLASRHHARVVPGQGGYYIADLDTANGTQVKGERIRNDSRWLTAGDTITIGGHQLRFLTGQQTQMGLPVLAPQVGTQLVQFDGKRTTIGRDPSNDVTLTDPNVSRFHAEVVATAQGIELRDLGSTNGTRLNGQLVTRALVQTGSEIGVGSFRLVFDGSSFLSRDDRGALRLDAEELTVRIRGNREILRRASVSMEPGEFTVIIGESGSGKSTLIKLLAGVTTPSEGEVQVNGQPVMSRLTDIGYVPQDEIVHGKLTIREALRYSAKLRLPQDSTPQDLDGAVDRVLTELSLEQHADTRIGSLSGGQRKRAGVATELLSRPSLLFLDEPTTGLDPGLETQLMELFRVLAEDGTRAVACVTHATKNLDLADKICVMGRGGDLAFFGTPKDALKFFKVDNYDAIYTTLDRHGAMQWRAQFEQQRAQQPPTERARPPQQVAAARAAPRPGKRPALSQTWVLVRRYARLFMRDSRNLAILLGQVPLIALGIGLLFKSNLKPEGGNPGEVAYLLFLLSTTAIWLGSIDGSREIIKEKALSIRETAVGVRLGSYLTSKAVVLFTLAAVQSLLLAVIVLLMKPLGAEGADVGMVLLLLIATSWVSVGMGLLISSAVGSEDQATSFIPLALIPQLLFAGAIVPVEKMGAAVAGLSNVVYSRWSFAGLGSAIDVNERLDAVPPKKEALGFGDSFFDISPAAGLLILLVFLVIFFVGVAIMLTRREST